MFTYSTKKIFIRFKWNFDLNQKCLTLNKFYNFIVLSRNKLLNEIERVVVFLEIIFQRNENIVLFWQDIRNVNSLKRAPERKGSRRRIPKRLKK